MRAFTYERATSAQEAAAKAQETPGAKFIAGGTNLLDLMKLEIETPRHLIDVNGLKFDKIEKTEDGGLRIGALVRNTALAADMRVRKRLWRPQPCTSRRRLRPASQQGDDGRQSAPAHALSLLLRHQSTLQQEKPRVGLCSDRGLQPPTGRDRRERDVHRYQSLRYGRRNAGARRRGGDHRRRGTDAEDTRSPISTGCPAILRMWRPRCPRAS